MASRGFRPSISTPASRPDITSKGLDAVYRNKEILHTTEYDRITPALSPDGKTIIFTASPGGWWQIHVVNADGTGERPFFDWGNTVVNSCQH